MPETLSYLPRDGGRYLEITHYFKNSILILIIEKNYCYLILPAEKLLVVKPMSKL